MEERDKINSDELQHWGIRGMRWGIRRYQNKDGSLTPAGEKRRAKLQKGLDDLDSKTGANTSKLSSKKKSAKDMSDEELKKRNNRMQLELDYVNKQKQLADLEPKKESKLKKIGAKALDAGIDATINAGKSVLQEFLTQQGKEAFKLNPKEKQKSKLEKEIEELGLLSKKTESLNKIYGDKGYDKSMVTKPADTILGVTDGGVKIKQLSMFN